MVTSCRVSMMETLAIVLVTVSVLMWLAVLLIPWRPWSFQPFLDAQSGGGDLSDVTVLIPARNEATVIQKTLVALKAQGNNLSLVVVDDQSVDGTAEIARKAWTDRLVVVAAEPLPSGWSGKLWALEQGRQHVQTPLVLLMDADIELKPGIVGCLREYMQQHEVAFISLMAAPMMSNFWEKLLMPAFVYFFKLLYPFSLSNSGKSKVAAAAGGCILMQSRLLDEIGGFEAIKGELIDDCSLAGRIKSKGHKTWIGLTHSVYSIRPYQQLRQIWNMVTRTAFTQLHYSIGLLLACTVLMALAFGMPVAGLFFTSSTAQYLALAAWMAMALSYLPMLKFYGRSPVWVVSLPLIGMLYLAMTWNSALRYLRGERARWKDRSYDSRANSMRWTFMLLPQFLAAGLLMANPVAPLHAAPPEGATAVVERFQSALISVMKDAQKLGYEGRYKRLAPAVEESHDLPGIAQFAVGRYWEKLSDQQKKAYEDAFARMSIATYAYRFDDYSGESFKVVSQEATGKGDATVHTLFSAPNKEDIHFDYVLRRKDGVWRIINIIVDGVSDLAIKRSEYGNIIRDQGADVLIAKLQGQIAEYSKPASTKNK
ncbi:MAG TPA: ABC transporter substrate-binding protein [Burkholderiales bacterium]|nr:ABC transporter substrate-binding protein [Burkholderiales bacterium]